MNVEMTNSEINTHRIICDFGKHKGIPYTRIPVSYLKWMVCETKLPQTRRFIAQAELDRRGTVTPTMDISGHAIDRASTKLWQMFLSRPDKDTGIYTWLEGLARDALSNGVGDGEARTYNGITFIFQMDCEWPVLKSVYPAKVAC